MRFFLTLAFLTLFITPAFAAGELQNPAIGATAPDFTTTDTNGHPQHLAAYKGKIVVLEWTNNQCPYVRKHYDSGNMQATQQAATAMGAIWLRVISSAPGKEGNVTADEANKIAAADHAAATATILDPSGDIGRMYGAKTTPTMAVIDTNGNLVYEGAIDDKASFDQADIATAKNYVRIALADLKSGQPIAVSRTPSYGCGVKY